MRELFSFLVATSLLASSSHAQTRTGTIEGAVLDATGQALPGVSVTLSGASLVSSQVTTTSDTGSYRFLALPPSPTYSLRFELPGFRTQLNEAVVVQAGGTTMIDVTLELSSVEEVVTVVGESPMMDVKSTVVGSSFDDQLLEEVPSARDVWSLLEHQAPGVATNRLDVGGSETGLQALYSARGTSWQQNSYYLNGVNVTCPAALGASGYYYDYDSFEEIQVETGSHPASVNAPGVYMNMVTKSGGNEYSGGTSFFYQSRDTQSDNLDQELIDRGASSAAFDYLSDFNAQLGGPIVRDRSTFYASFRDERVHRFVPGFPAGCDPDQPETCITEDTDMWQFLVKNTTQINDKNRVGGEWHHMSYYKPWRGAAGNRPPEATWVEDDTFDIIQAEWTSTISENALLDTRFSHLRVFFPTFQQPDATLQPGQDLVTGQFLNARDFEVQRRRRRYTFKSDLTYFKEDWGGADHELAFGLELSHNPITNDTTTIGDVFLRFRDGVSDQVDLRNTPRFDAQTLNQTSFFIDDIITLNRATLKLGLRWDRYNGYLPEQESPSGSWVPARTFPEVSGVLDVASFAPRLGFVYDVRGDGEMLFKTSWGRYYHQFTTGFINFANENGDLSDTWTWDDLNGDSQFQDGEEVTLLRSQLANSNIVDPDFQHPYTDEFTIGLETQLSADTAVSFVYSNRRGRRLNDTIDIGVPFSAYTPLQVQDPGPDGAVGTGDDGGTVTVYNQNANTIGQGQFMLTNPEVVIPDTGETVKNEQNYNGFEVIFNKRFRSDWSALVSYSYNKTDTITRGGDGEGDVNNNFFINPNQLINAEGRSFYDRTNQFKVAATYYAPYGVRIGGVLRYQTGQPFARTFVVPGLNQGSITVLAEPVGEQRLPNVTTSDLTFAKDFSFGDGRYVLAPQLEMFNIFNANTETAIITNSGGSYGQVLNFLSPRIFRFGVRLRF